jgi:hypothetical protein
VLGCAADAATSIAAGRVGYPSGVLPAPLTTLQTDHEHPMRKLLLSVAIAATMSLPASAADERNFTIVNGTGYEISFIGVNPPGDNDFGENELGSGLADGGSVYVKFNGADKGCFWNIKVKWSGYQEQVFFEGLDLCSITSATLKYDRESKKTTALIQ